MADSIVGTRKVRHIILQITIETKYKVLKWIHYHFYEVEPSALYAGLSTIDLPALQQSRIKYNTKPEAMQCTSIENRKDHRQEIDQPRSKTGSELS